MVTVDVGRTSAAGSLARWRLVAVAVASLALTSCEAAPDGGVVLIDTRTEPAFVTGVDPTAQPATGREPAHEGPPVTIAFGGDVMFEGMIRPQLDANPEGLLDPIAPVLRRADLAVVNLETAITTGQTAAQKQYVFAAPATALVALSSAGVDVASLANNHGMDFGTEGLVDSLDASEEVGLRLIGAGRDDAEAYAPFTTTIRGRDIAVIGATQVMDSGFLADWPATDDRPGLASAKDEHEDRLVQQVEESRADVDTVVVFLHWGIEREQCPSERQQALARLLVDAGADIVVGGHAHRLQGAGMLDGALVGYGLGNFVFYTRAGPGAQTGVLTVTVEGREILGYTWTPAVLRAGIPHPLEAGAAAAALSSWNDLRRCTSLEP